MSCATPTFAISPAQVQRLLDNGEKITFVDVRLKNLYQDSHIPGAINIPSQLVPEKQLPPLGQVVVYDDGLGEDLATAAAGALNQKNGITAEVLDGGYAAWQTARSDTTQTGGMKPEVDRMITYAELQKAQNGNVVLVDLRTPPAATVSANAKVMGANVAAPATTPLTDLQAEFPQAKVVKSPFGSAAVQPKVLSTTATTPPLLVLVDNGDGRARKMARILKANGNTRFVILAGGEQILAVHGQAGLQRIGSSVSMKTSADPRAAATP